MIKRFLIPTILAGLVVLPVACGDSKSSPSAPVTVFYVPVTATPGTPTITPTPLPHSYITQWGALGSGDGSFSFPTGITVNSAGTTIWVADYGNSRIQYFTGAGVFLGKWGSYGVTTDGPFSDGRGLFNSLYGIALNSSGTTLYVADTSNNRIQYFSDTGAYIGQWGGTGSGNGAFSSPTGVAINSTGTTVFVADVGNNRIQYFSATGSYLGQWTHSGTHPLALAVNSAGTTVYVADNYLARVDYYSGTGTHLGFWGGAGSSNGLFSHPQGVAVNTTGIRVYVADSDNNRIQEFGGTGIYRSQWDGSSGGSVLNSPNALALDSSMNVYVVDVNNNRIMKFGP